MPHSPPGEAYLTADEVAEVLRVSVRTVLRHALALGGLQVGDTWRYPHPKHLATRRAS